MLPVTSQQTLPGQQGGECEPQSCKWHLGGALQGWETNCAWKQKAGVLEEPESSSKMRGVRCIVTHQEYLSLSLISLVYSNKWTS